MNKVATIPKTEVSVPITPMEMLQTAVEQGADLDKLTKLMDLQERWEANEARKAFVAALSAFKANPPDLLKNKSVSYANKTGGKTEYDHATLDNVSNTIGKALSEHGLSHRWDVDQLDGGIIKVTCILTHIMGHSEKVPMQSPPDASGGKNSIQAVGSTVTYLQRYTLLAATGMATQDHDDDGAKADAIDAEQKETIINLIKETGADTKKFLAFLGAGSVDQIPADRFQFAADALMKKRGK